jgi:hypothetical protein
MSLGQKTGTGAAVTVLVLAALFYSCSQSPPTEHVVNLPPQTHLFLSLPDSVEMPDTSTSEKILHWYGDDPDGEVVGYYYAWDDTSDTSWTLTERVTDTFYVPIREAYGEFTFYVKALDNEGLEDPTPARMTFPVINSPPKVEFPVDFVINYSGEDFVSFTVFTFGWSGSDLDGDETITSYEYYLGSDTIPVDSATFETLDWSEVPGEENSLTLRGIEPGYHRFFLRAIDIAGAKSPVIYYPDTTGSWLVKEPVGELLYVDDNRYFYNTEWIYTDILDSIYGENGYSIWNVEDHISYCPKDITETLRFFSKVVWNSGSYPHFSEAQNGLVSFLNSGGHLMVASTYASAPYQDTTMYSFLPMDSVTITNIIRPAVFYSQHSWYEDIRPTTPLSYTFGFRPATPSALAPDSVSALYRVQDQGGPIAGARYPAEGSARVIFFSFPVHDCNEDDAFRRLLPFVVMEEFQG